MIVSLGKICDCALHLDIFLSSIFLSRFPLTGKWKTGK